MSRYSIEYDPRTESELRRLPVAVRRQIDHQLELLSASPFRSHPGVHVKPTAQVDGVWHFHAGRHVRVYYFVVGAVVWVVNVERSPGVTRKVLRELRKRA